MNRPNNRTRLKGIGLCLFLSLLSWMQACPVSAKDGDSHKVDKIYMFGFAASFTDSLVYFTEIQTVRGAYITNKKDFLVNREEYSNQLRNYLRTKGNQHPTCVTIYGTNLKAVAKEYVKLKEKYTKKAKGNFILKDIESNSFQYKPVEPEEGMVIVDSKEAEKAAREAKKEGKNINRGPKPPKEGVSGDQH